MELTQVTPTVWQLPFPVGHVHFVRLPNGFALIDTGLPGSAPAILDALARLGGRPPAHTAPERALHEQILAGLAESGVQPPRHVPVDEELHDGDTLTGWGEPVHVLHVPGHTPGSIALHLPDSGVLFPGDNIATTQGRVILGPFNVDREQAIASFRRLAALEVDVLCVPHGEPVLKGAREVLRAAVPESDWV